MRKRLAVRAPEAIGFAERLFMKLIKGLVGGLVLTGMLAFLPAAAMAHGGGGQSFRWVCRAQLCGA
jgi:hypothetical protein